MTMAANITVIPAKRIVGTQRPEARTQKKRVAAYCRVSTEYEEQESSYEVQVQHYTDYIKSNPKWELAGIYADDGISATSTAKREAFNRMIQDCRDGRIDMILTKSISRFSRNTVDCLKYTRELKGLNIAVYFEKENINTLDAKGEVLMTIMAALAQQESESLSANVRLGIQFRNQQGRVMVNHNRFLGYTRDADGNLIIDPEQAKVVKRIYAEFLDGATFPDIKRGLERDGILNGAGHAKWYVSNIRQILTNEKYIGDALLQKTYTINTLEKTRVRNNGYAPKYYVEGSHEPIISKEVYYRAQAEMTRRSNLFPRRKKCIYTTKYVLSGIVICGHCGDIYRRVKWNNHGCKSTVWRCVSRLEKDRGVSCHARTIREEALHYAVLTAINDAWYRWDDVLPILKENLREVLERDTKEKLDEVNTAIMEKQEELLAAGRDQSKIDEIGAVIVSLREQQKELLSEATENTERKYRIEELTDFLDAQTSAITEYSDVLVRRLIDKITVYDEKVTVEFRSGFTIDVDV